MATCQQNPLSLHVYAGPNIAAQLKLALIKVAIVLVAGQFMSQRRWQAGLLLALCAWALWISLRQVRLSLWCVKAWLHTVCLMRQLHAPADRLDTYHQTAHHTAHQTAQHTAHPPNAAPTHRHPAAGTPLSPVVKPCPLWCVDGNVVHRLRGNRTHAHATAWPILHRPGAQDGMGAQAHAHGVWL